MKRTGIFATDEEAREIGELHDQAQKTPVIALTMMHGLSTGGFSEEAWTLVKKTVHKYALVHGLPEIEGYYGFDRSNNEFVSV